MEITCLGFLVYFALWVSTPTRTLSRISTVWTSTGPGASGTFSGLHSALQGHSCSFLMQVSPKYTEQTQQRVCNRKTYLTVSGVWLLYFFLVFYCTCSALIWPICVFVVVHELEPTPDQSPEEGQLSHEVCNCVVLLLNLIISCLYNCPSKTGNCGLLPVLLFKPNIT